VGLWFGPERPSSVAMTPALTNPLTRECGKAGEAEEGKLNRGASTQFNNPLFNRTSRGPCRTERLYAGRGRLEGMALHRLRDWEEFKRRFSECKAKTVFYAIEDYPLGRPPISLRLLFTCRQDTYQAVEK